MTRRDHAWQAGWSIFLAGLLSLCCLGAWASAAVQVLHQAHFTRVPPTEGATAATEATTLWEDRTLPDAWNQRRMNDRGLGLYRLHFTLAQPPTEPWAVHVAFAQSAMALVLNGHALLREPAFDALHLVARTSPPVLAVMPQHLLQPGENTLDVRVRVERDLAGGLSDVRVGPLRRLQPAYQMQTFWRVELPRALNMACLVAALFMGLLWLRRPRESIYPWFCALALTWGLRAAFFTDDWTWLVPERLQLSWGGQPLLVAQSLLLGCCLLVVVLNRFAITPRPWLERGLLVLCVLVPLALAPGGQQVVAPVTAGLWGLACGVGALAVALALRLAWRQRQPGMNAIAVGVCLWWATLLHEWATMQGWLAFSPLPLQSYGPPVLLATMVLGLGGLYFRAFDEAARLNTELDQRVRDKTQQLEHHFERIAQLEREAAITQERDRLMRDMHDGVGSQLITLQHAIERGKVSGPQAATLVRECVDDLRLVIESLDGAANAMPDALANLRFRMEPRLTAAGVRSRWHIDETPFVLPPGSVLQLLRILQEAISNTLKHAQAHELQVSWQVDPLSPGVPSGACLQVCDDGVGLPDPATSAPMANQIGHAGSGHGLGNMALRAQRAGASLHIGPHENGGTRVTVHVAPAPAPAAP